MTDLGSRRRLSPAAARNAMLGLLAAGVLVVGGCSTGSAASAGGGSAASGSAASGSAASGSAADGSAPGDAVASGPDSVGGADVVVGQDNPNAGIEPVSSVVSTAIAPATNGQRVIVVQAVGKVTGTPDTVTIGVGVQTTASTAGAALDENNAKAKAVIAVLKGKGVADADLQTSGLSVSPTYSNSGNTITGYQVTNSLTVTLHGIDKAGAIIDAVQSAAGDATRIDQLSFSIGDSSSLRTAARTEAVKQATASAKQLAAAAGVQVGQVLSITEDPDDQTTPPVYAAADSAAGSVPIQAGTQDLTVTVQLVFAIA